MDAATESSIPVTGDRKNEEHKEAAVEGLTKTTTATTTTTATAGTPQAATDTETTAPDDHSDATTTRCVICLDAVSEPCVAQPCGHRHFDFLCLVSWLLQRQPSCPLCKATVATVQYSFSADGRSWKTLPVPAPESESEKEAPAQATVRASRETDRGTRPDRRERGRSTRSARSARPPDASLADASLARRRRVYRLGLYSLHVGANRHSRYYRELTPQLFVQDPDLVSRARAFVRRELTVLLPGGLTSPPRGGASSSSSSTSSQTRNTANAEFLLEYIVAILKTIDIQGSAGQAEELLREFFGRDHTRLFLHELRSWLRSPYLTLASWDRHVQYGRPASYAEAERSEEGRRERRENGGNGENGGSGGDGGNSSSDRVGRHRDRPPQQHGYTRTGGSHWRPSTKRAGKHRDGRHGQQPAVADRPPRYRPRRNEAALEEACRRYDPS